MQSVRTVSGENARPPFSCAIACWHNTATPASTPTIRIIATQPARAREIFPFPGDK
jgi:hypothetical protein